MPTIKLSEVKFDATIYPRNKPSSTIIDEYADAMLSGDVFPPIKLEAESNRLLDGYHRWKAQQRLVEQPGLNGQGQQFAEIEAEFLTVPEGIPVKLFAFSLSKRNGHRLTAAEARDTAREVCGANPDFSTQVIAEHVGRSERSVMEYVKDIKGRRKEQQRAVILRLDLLGWTQDEIAGVVGLKQNTVNEKLSEIAELRKAIKSTLATGIPHQEVAERFNLPLQVVWALDLDGLDDAQRMERLKIKTQPYDVWQFPSCHDLFGAKHPGRIPGEIVAHVLYFFTQPKALVLDPMAGSGTTPDVCLALGRRCYAYDIDDRHERKDIITHNIAAAGWSERVKKADLIFWDPPYYKKKDALVDGPDGYIEGSISNLDVSGYLRFFADRLTEARSLVKSGARLAFLMSDWDDEHWENKPGAGDSIFIWDYANIIQKAGWRLLRHIQVPLSTQQVHPDIVNKFRESRRLARLERYLLIAEA